MWWVIGYIITGILITIMAMSWVKMKYDHKYSWGLPTIVDILSWPVLFIMIIVDEVMTWYDHKMTNMKCDTYKDAAGGIHDEGMGWNPNGTFCGECSYNDCTKCPTWAKHKGDK